VTGPDDIPFIDEIDNQLAGRHLSRSRLATNAATDQVPHSTIMATLNGRRYPTISVMDAVAQALDIDPHTWPEYRLAIARHELDERAVGLESALSALERR
jgi:transcriptional regulator with XRE-family HTH domain